MKVSLILGQQFEEIEAITPIDLFRRAGIQVDTFGVNAEEITGSHDITIKADFLFTETSTIIVNNYDALILPGGPAVNHLIQNTAVIELIRNFHQAKKIIFAICAAPRLLDKAGVLENKDFTCFPTAREEIKSGRYQRKNFIHDDLLLTTEGVGTIIEASLYFVSWNLSPKVAKDLAEKIASRDTY